MGKVYIQKRTCTDPITLIGEEAGICYGANTEDPAKNYKRALDCLESEHGRTFEFPDVYFVLDGYSAKVIREFYTHIGGAPTRLQASTRYIDYKNFDYIVPSSVSRDKAALDRYLEHMAYTGETMRVLEENGVPREDSSLVLPFAMATRMVGKYNLRTLIDMSHARECTRAYWEFRELFRDLKQALHDYSEEWAFLVDHYFMPKCEYKGFCPEKRCCGRVPKREGTA